MIKKLIKKIISYHKNTIIFESNPDFSDNTKAVFDAFLDNRINLKYKLVWILFSSNQDDYPKIKNVKFISYKSRWSTFYIHKAKVIVFCNRFIEKVDDRQLSFYLGHGSSLKNAFFYDSKLPSSTDYVINESSFFTTSDKKKYKHINGKIVSLGYPRTDILLSKNEGFSIKSLFKDVDFKNAVIWMPTVRQNKNSGANNFDYPISIVNDFEYLKKLEEYLEKKKMLLVIKIHPAQADLFFGDNSSNYLCVVTNSFLVEQKLNNYEFLKMFDALLTDYSSVYYDFTLCDKPIGLIWEDIEEFKTKTGFAIDPNIALTGGYKIYNYNDLTAFLDEISLGFDSLINERRKNRDLTNYSLDGKSSLRVMNFIIEKAKL